MHTITNAHTHTKITHIHTCTLIHSEDIHAYMQIYTYIHIHKQKDQLSKGGRKVERLNLCINCADTY